MNVIPAIDILGGKVVRLSQGRFSDEILYSDSPVDMAKRWESCGAAMIHVVDLDGAREGRVRNLELVRGIASAVKSKIELGGGIRDEGSIRDAIEAGVSKVVIGTKALDAKFLAAAVKGFGSAIVVGIDACEGMVCTKGWVFKTKSRAVDTAKMVESLGAATINYTDISRDGMLAGPNIESVAEILAATKLDVVLAGGISSIDDIKRLGSMPGRRPSGVIIGKALYEGRIDLREAIKLAKE